MLNERVAALDGLTAEHRLAVPDHGPRAQIALAVGEGLVELHREGVREVVENVFPRGEVDLDVAPFGCRDEAEPSLHQRLAGRDDLDHRRMPFGEVPLDRADQRRRFHRGEEMAEEALLGALEGGARRGLRLAIQRPASPSLTAEAARTALAAGDIGGFERGVQIAVDDAEGLGIGVVDRPLRLRQLVLDEFVAHALVGE